jgi:chaperonin GroES
MIDQYADPAEMMEAPKMPGYDAEYLGDQPMGAAPTPANIIRLLEWAEADNIAFQLKDDVLVKLGQQAHEQYKIDDESRADWAKTARRALDLISGKKEAKNFPFENASNVKVPLLLSAVNQFASRCYPALIKNKDIVKTTIEGKDADGQKLARSQRIEQHMSYQLLHQMPEWEEDTDVLTHQLPAVGCAFRQTYWGKDRYRNRARSELVSALNLVVNNTVASLEDAPQITKIFTRYPHQIAENVRKKLWLDQDLKHAEAATPEDSKSGEAANNPNAPHTFCECYCYYDLDGDDAEEPWIVTVHEATQKVVRVAPGYGADGIEAGEDGTVVCIKRDDYFTKYTFWPDAKGGFYGRGLGHALEDLSETINTSLNQMLDSGTLQNAGGGFIGSGLNTKKSTYRFAPGVYHVVNTPGSTIRDAIVNMEHPGASPTLFQLLGLLMEMAKQVSGNQDVLSGDVQTNMQPTTLMALIEQGLQQFTAIYMRIYRALGREFQLLRRLNAKYLSDEEYNRYLDPTQPASAQEDYGEGDMDLYPVANPNIVTHMQRAARNQFLMEMSKDPELGRFIKKPIVLMRVLKDAQIEEIDEVIEENPQPSPAEEAQMAKLQAESELAQMKVKELQAKIIDLEAKHEEMQANAAKQRIDGGKAMMEAEDIALNTSIREAMAARLGDIEDVEQITIQGVGSIKEQDKTTTGAGGAAQKAAA